MSEQGSHFWFMAIQTPNGPGFNMGSYQGTLTPPRGTTRLDFLNRVRAQIEEEYPQSRGGAVVAFDVQLNRL